MFTAIAWLLLCTLLAAAQPPDRAKLLYDSGWKKMDGFIQHFRRTGDHKSKLPELDTAAGEFAESARLYLADGGQAEAALSLVRQADCLRTREQWADALAIYERAIRLARDAGHSGYLAWALLGAAKAESVGRKYGAALARLEEAISLSTSPEDRRVHVESLEQKAHVQESLRCMSAAAATLGRALKVAEDLKDETRLVYVHYARGSVCAGMARECAPRWQLAQARCREAIDQATAHLTTAQRLANKLGYYGLAKLINSDESLEFLRIVASRGEQSSRTMLEARGFEPEVPSHVLVHEIFAGTGEAGGEYCQQLRRVGEPILTGKEDALRLNARGLMELVCGRADDALVLFRKAIEELEKDRRNAPDECGPGSFLQDKTALYEQPAALLLQRQDRAGAFELLERSRSSVLADLLATQKLGLSDARERELYAEAAKLQAEIGLVQKRLFELDSTPDRQQHAAEIAVHRAKLVELEASYQRLMDRMGREAPRLKDLTASQPITLTHLQDALRRDRLEMLYYLVRDTEFILWHIGPEKEDVHVRVVFLPRPALVQKVEELRRSLTDEHAEFNERRAHQLFLYLIKPALEWLKSDNLVIVPHDVLHFVPFQILFDRASKTFVGERFRISYAPSATILARLRSIENLAGGRLFAAVGPGLPHGRLEVEAIAKLYPGRSRLLAGVATETGVKKSVSGAQVVHLATHGEFNPREPLLSSLELAKSAEDDGDLTAAEMFGLPLEQAALVVLSACESGRVPASGANEILGTVRALLYAGAGSLLLTSWKVYSPATSLWMRTFYREAQRNSPREAARLALLALKNHPKYSRPFYWGPFLLVGK